MRVTSNDTSIYSLITPRKKASLSAESGINSLPQLQTNAPATLGKDRDVQISEFQARLAKSNFERNDLNGDGYVSRDEFTERNMQKRGSGYQASLEDVTKLWNSINRAGKDNLNEEEFATGFNTTLKVSMGSIDRPLR
ncbi:hypothetical protein [Ensifer sp. ENS12]|uniref:hypothetical protein n=1 Tax=Ensifer sp. ENS12 TaxID=2854774 RepID=UPI000DE492AB|nr:hypothetical protein [Ensifer sp. ENS12]MBV7518856.1 hypothetical protein [Ensifer sp. ENS12]